MVTGCDASTENVVIASTYKGVPVKVIYGEAFKVSTATSVYIPGSVESIEGNAFKDCSTLETITFGENSKLLSIGNSAFNSCSPLTSIVIPAGVVSIGDYAFNFCSILKTIYYGGTAEQWKAVKIGSNNDPLLNESIYYYSKTEPTEDGNFWYYDKDGKVAVW